MADQAQQTFAIVNEKGEVIFEFQGVISAQGLILQEGTFEGGKSNTIEWLNSGNQRESITGFSANAGLDHTIAMRSRATSPGDTAEFAATSRASGNFSGIFSSNVGPPALGAAVSLASNLAAETASVSVSAKGAAGNVIRTLIDQAEQSHFLQLVFKEKRKVSFGSTIVKYPGGTIASNPVTISHGLGVVPSAVIVKEIGFWSEVAEAQMQNINAVNFETRHTFQTFKPALGAEVFIMWMAIG